VADRDGVAGGTAVAGDTESGEGTAEKEKGAPLRTSTNRDKVLLIRHTVATFKKWKSVFDAHGPTRKAHGCKGGLLLRSAHNPNELVIILRWSDLERARRFAADDLREMMAQAGVSDLPDVYLLDELETIAE